MKNHRSWSIGCDPVGRHAVLSQGYHFVAFDTDSLESLFHGMTDDWIHHWPSKVIDSTSMTCLCVTTSPDDDNWSTAPDCLSALDMRSGAALWKERIGHQQAVCLGIDRSSHEILLLLDDDELARRDRASGSFVRSEHCLDLWPTSSGHLLLMRVGLFLEVSDRRIPIVPAPPGTEILSAEIVDDVLVVSCVNGTLLGYSLHAGTLLWEMPAPRVSMRDMVRFNNRRELIGFGSFKEDGRERLLHIDIERQCVSDVTPSMPDQRENVSGAIASHGRAAVLYNGYMCRIPDGQVVRLPWVCEDGRLANPD